MRIVLHPFKNLQYDVPASVVVMLVALPLCLGIALASGAPMLSGLIAGVVGGIVIGTLSGANLSVSGPAAGLTTIVLSAVSQLGSYNAFLCAVMLGGLFQVILGLVRAGTIGHFFPVSVVKGMLSAIGLILILKQIPHALGYDRDFEGDEDFVQDDGQNTFSEIFNALDYVTPGAIVISIVSIAVMIAWEKPWVKKMKLLRFVPGPLVVVLLGIFLNAVLSKLSPGLAIKAEHLVALPRPEDIVAQMTFPDWQQLLNKNVYLVGITLGLVASLETLLSIEAADKLDPFKRTTPLNRELTAQGIGNIVSGMIGGLPITAVIVRTSANINAGARTKLSTILHGTFLLSAVMLIPSLLNLIPFSCLAAILIVTGYKLTKPELFRQIYRKGWDQFVPFMTTIVAILITNLLVGIFVGMCVGLFYVLKTNFHRAISVSGDDENYVVRLNKDVSFLNKALLRKTFQGIPDGVTLTIDGGGSRFVDTDIIETIEDFVLNAPSRNIRVHIKRTATASNSFFKLGAAHQEVS